VSGFVNQPALTGERFAEFLPYGMALDVEDAWAKRLVAAVGIAAAAEVTRRAISSRYSGGSNFNPNTLAQSMRSNFAGAISSASTAPGNSLGRSGSSGGGGGWGRLVASASTARDAHPTKHQVQQRRQ